MPVTAFYAGLLAILFLVLSVRVIVQRRVGKVALGDGGDARLLRRMRVQANFSEYVPLALILMGLAESLGARGVFLHGCGALLLVGRLCHAIGVSQDREDFRLRVVGIGLTITVIAVLAVSAIGTALAR
jgi:uncharacterized membrane protein YecN with MAPEG domain